MVRCGLVAERSQAAAIYDHRHELAELDPSAEFWQTRARSSILAVLRDLALLDKGDILGYDVGKLLFRLRGGYMTSAGQDRAIERVLADVDMTVTQVQIDKCAAEMVQQRREYIRRRYGVE